MSTEIRYVFHEIEIHDLDHKEQVKNLIRVYRDIPTNSIYKDIKNLIPRLTYTVLIERPDQTTSVRLYFNSDDIDDNEKSAQERNDQNGEPQPSKKLADGVYSDTFDTENNSVSKLSVFDNFSDNLQGIGEQYKFLHCFYIPYITEYKVFFTLPNNLYELQRDLYQTDQNKFKVSHPRGIKFLLSAEAPNFPKKKQQKENYLIQAYRRYCQEKGGNITKNGDPLSQEQKRRIDEVKQQVDDMKGTCDQLQRSHRGSSTTTTDIVTPGLGGGQDTGPGGQNLPQSQQDPFQDPNNSNGSASSTSTTSTVTPGGGQDLTLQELRKRYKDLLNLPQNTNDGKTNASSTTLPLFPDVPTHLPTSNAKNSSQNSPQNTNDGKTNASSTSTVTPGSGGQNLSIQDLRKAFQDLNNDKDNKTIGPNSENSPKTPYSTPRHSFSQSSQGSQDTSSLGSLDISSLHNPARNRSSNSTIDSSSSSISLDPSEFQSISLSGSQILDPSRDQAVNSKSSSTVNKVREHIQNLQKLQTKIKQDSSNKKVIKCIKRKKKNLRNPPPFVVPGGRDFTQHDITKYTHRNTNSGI